MYAYIVEDYPFEVIQGSFDGIQGYAHDILHIRTLFIYGGMYVDRRMRIHILRGVREGMRTCTDML